MVAIEINGQIKTYSTIPTEWKNTIGYNYEDASVHYVDGFRNVVEPSYDTTLSYKGAMIYDSINNVFTYEVIDYTVEQLDANLTIKEETEDKSDQDILNQKGIRLYERTKNRLIRRNKKGLLSKAKCKKVREALHPVFLKLRTGDIDLANDTAILIPTNTQADVEAELARFKGELAALLIEVNSLI